MGGVCPGGSNSKKKEKEKENKRGVSGQSRSPNNFNKLPKESTYSNPRESDYWRTPPMYDSGELWPPSFSSELKPSKPSTPSRKASSKSTPKVSFLGRAGTVGLDRAVEVLDTLGSSMSNLNPGSGFVSGIASRGNQISILAFEVANTIVKGANLMQSLSEENIQFLKKEVLHSEGVRQLVSTETKELLMIAASDKREELEVFSREVIRFGDLCKDPQWHNLHRFFSRLDTDSDDLGQKQQRTEANTTMQELSTLAEHTSELYHELHALDRFEQDYKQRVDEAESLNLPRKGEGITMSLSELKHQKKLVRTLKKKSLWSKTLEEVMEKLVDVVTFIHQEILDIFGDNGTTFLCKDTTKGLHQTPQRLGPAGLALHYANVINLIDTIASRPALLPPNARDSLYNGLPPTVKKSLRSYLQTKHSMAELSVSKVKGEMEKTLQWLVPVATNTIKAHQGFGWVGEWANTGSEFGKSKSPSTNLIRLQTLYHADKQKSDAYLLEMVTWLHRLFNLVRHREDASIMPFPRPSLPNTKQFGLHSKLPSFSYKPRKTELSDEDRDLLNRACRRRLVPGISKSQEFDRSKQSRVCEEGRRSEGNSPNRVYVSKSKKKKETQISVWDMMDGLHPATLSTAQMIS